jgi:hypothetical protein
LPKSALELALQVTIAEFVFISIFVCGDVVLSSLLRIPYVFRLHRVYWLCLRLNSSHRDASTKLLQHRTCATLHR